MIKLKPAVLYNCSTKIKPIGIFYLVQYTIFALICIIINICTGKNQNGSNGLELCTIVFVSITGVLSFKEDFKTLLQNGYTRKYIFLSTVCMFVTITGSMAIIDTVIGNVLHHFISGYNTIFGMMYGYDNLLLNWLWLTVVYMLFCSLFYLAVLVINKVGKMTSLLIGVGLVGVILVIVSLFRFVFSSEIVSNIMRFVMNAMGFMNDGTQNLLFPILSFFGIGFVLTVCSYAIIRRTELN